MREGKAALLPVAAFSVAAGAAIGLATSVLEKLGNPPNMGLCVVCFERDVAGALGFHRMALAQYVRPEIPGLLLGATIAAFLTGSFRARTGSTPVIRFLMGVLASVGALVFMGCSWRMLGRLAGLDLNAVVGLAGFAAGVLAAGFFIRRGFALAPSRPAPRFVGLLPAGIMIGVLLLALLTPEFKEGGPIFMSAKGPGSLFAPLAAALAAGLLIGFLSQRSGFCTVKAILDPIVHSSYRMTLAVLAFLLAAFVAKLAFGLVKFGFAAQPIAHSAHLWNFLGMVLAGLAFALGGGCPGRQLVAAGQGDTDAALFVSGAFAGTALAHNLFLAAGPDRTAPDGTVLVGGPGPAGQVAVLLGIGICVAVGLLVRERSAAG